MRDTVDECRRRLADASPDDLPELVTALAGDDRAGVRAAVSAAVRRLERFRAEETRLDRLAAVEEGLHSRGCAIVAGVDEVGRGALAGPLTAGAVVLAPGTRIAGLDDSKRLKPVRREELATQIRARSLAWSVAHVGADVVDSLGMTAALKRVMREALAGLAMPLDHVVLDGNPLHIGPPETAVVGGDSKVAAIAAASIVAKVARDAIMCELDTRHPGYGFVVNKGYGTAEHLEAIARLGVSVVHRRSFAPCAQDLRLFS